MHFLRNPWKGLVNLKVQCLSLPLRAVRPLPLQEPRNPVLYSVPYSLLQATLLLLGIIIAHSLASS